MTIARSQQICLKSTPYYHCTNRCVRRAYLCGNDPYTHKNYDHRREWIEEILLKLTNTFCIEVATFSVLPKQYHLVVKIAPEQIETLSDNQVIDRWSQLYTVSASTHYFRQGYILTETQSEDLRIDLTHWRTQLISLSRFIGYLNEKIARRANKEDDLTGRFWESRFSSHAVHDLEAFFRTNKPDIDCPSRPSNEGDRQQSTKNPVR